MAEPGFEPKKASYRAYILRFSEISAELGAGEVAEEGGRKLGWEGLGTY